MLIPFVIMILIPFLIYDYIDKSKSLELIYNFGIFFIPFLIFVFYTQMSYFRAQKQISIIVERNFPDRIQLPLFYKFQQICRHLFYFHLKQNLVFNQRRIKIVEYVGNRNQNLI